MKYHFYTIVLFIIINVLSCNKEEADKSERFTLLTSHAWINDSLLANGVESGGSGQLLEKFAGKTEFKEDGTGYLGIYAGDWFFNSDETALSIDSDSLAAVATASIEELTEHSLKIITIFPARDTTFLFYNIRMTFKPYE